MILGVGIDSVSIERFKKFSDYQTKQLLKFYSPDEITYCLKIPHKSTERFAARFAAKEALYKALSQATGHAIPFFLTCKSSSLSLTPSPCFIINWRALKIGPFHTLTTLTHTATDATALVIIQNNLELSQKSVD